MPIIFPSSPTLGQIYILPNGGAWEWNGFAWQSLGTQSATGAGGQHAAGYTLKYSEAFTAGGTVQINTTGVANGTWTVESFRVYGIT